MLICVTYFEGIPCQINQKQVEIYMSVFDLDEILCVSL